MSLRMIRRVGRAARRSRKVVNLVAQFTSEVSPTNNLSYSFEGSPSTSNNSVISSWAWKFGDATTANGEFVAHDYAGAGTYMVELTVTDALGETATASSEVIIEEVVVRVAPEKPVTNIATIGGGFVTMGWTHQNTDADTMLVYLDGVLYDKHLLSGGDQYTYTGLTGGKEYIFEARAQDSTINVISDMSDPLSATPTAPIIALHDLGTMYTYWNTSTAVSTTDSTDPTIARVSHLPTIDPSLFNTTLTHSTESVRPILVTEGEYTFLRFGFDNTNDRLYYTNSGLVQNTPAFTIGVRFRAKSLETGIRSLFTTSSSRFYLTLNEGVLEVGGRGSGSTNEFVKPSTTDYRDDLWHDVVVCYDYFNARLAVLEDGVVTYDQPWQVALAGLNTADADSNLYLGANGTSSYWRGDISEAVCYREFLPLTNAAEIHRTFSNNAGISAPATKVRPDAPATVTASPAGSGEVSVKWSEVAVAASYRIINKGTNTTLATVTAPASSHLLTGLTNDVEITLIMRTVDSEGTLSGDSPSATVTPTEPVVVAPTADPATLGNLIARFSAESVTTTGPMEAGWVTTDGLTTALPTAPEHAPVREVIDGRACVTFGPRESTVTTSTTDPTTGEVTTTSTTGMYDAWLKIGASALSNAAYGLAAYAVIWLPYEQFARQHVLRITASGGWRFLAGVGSGHVLLGSKQLNSSSFKRTLGVDDYRDGSWHLFQWVHDAATGDVLTAADGVLEHKVPALHPVGGHSATDAVNITIGATTNSKSSTKPYEPLRGSIAELLLYEGSGHNSPDKGAEVAAALGFVPETKPEPTYTVRVEDDITPLGIVRDFYRCQLVFSESATYQIRPMHKIRQVWEFTGNIFRVPFMDPVVYTFQSRVKLSTGKWSAWQTGPSYAAREWPTTSGDELRWAMPNAWGKTYPITEIILKPHQEEWVARKDGHYLIKPPQEAWTDTDGVTVHPAGYFDTNRFDLKVANTDSNNVPLTEVLIKVEGGQWDSDPDARINMKLFSYCETAWHHLQIEGVEFTGGNTGDTVQMSWNGVRDGTLVTQNSKGALITWGAVEHSDTHQLYAGPNTWKCDRWDGASDYQGTILFPQQVNRFLQYNGGFITAWPLQRTIIRMTTRTTKDGTGYVSVAGIPYYSWHDQVTGAPWMIYDKTPNSMKGLWVTRDEKAPAGGDISCWYINPDTYEVYDSNVKPGHWDGVTRLGLDANGVPIQPPEAFCLTGAGTAPGANYDASLVTYAPTGPRVPMDEVFEYGVTEPTVSNTYHPITASATTQAGTSGLYKITSPGTYENIDFTSYVTIDATNATAANPIIVQGNRFRGPTNLGSDTFRFLLRILNVKEKGAVIVQHNLFDPDYEFDQLEGVRLGGNAIVRYNIIERTTDGATLLFADNEFYGNIVRNGAHMATTTQPDGKTHNDGVVVAGGANNKVYLNWITDWHNAAIFVKQAGASTYGAITGLEIRKNRAGEATTGATIHVYRSSSETAEIECSVTDNTLLMPLPTYQVYVASSVTATINNNLRSDGTAATVHRFTA